MIPTLRLLVRAAAPALLVAGVVAACATSADSGDKGGAGGSGGCIGPQCTATDGGDRDNYVWDANTSDVQQGDDEAAAPPFNPACGSECLPDDIVACAGTQPEAGVKPDAGADASSDAALEGAYAPTEAGDAAPVEASAPVFGCHVKRTKKGVAGVCEEAGSGAADAPCVGSADCAPGLGCVGEGTAGQCRPFCCDEHACDSDAGGDQYCALRALRDDPGSSSTPLEVPVCVPADNCNLAEPYPCTAAQPEDCTCKDPSTACIVVHDGVSACVPPPGEGKAGEACPCAWGHVCSAATQKCLKICSLTAVDAGCGTGKCQATKEIPGDFGVCVGSSSADGG